MERRRECATLKRIREGAIIRIASRHTRLALQEQGAAAEGVAAEGATDEGSGGQQQQRGVDGWLDLDVEFYEWLDQQSDEWLSDSDDQHSESSPQLGDREGYCSHHEGRGSHGCRCEPEEGEEECSDCLRRDVFGVCECDCDQHLRGRKCLGE